MQRDMGSSVCNSMPEQSYLTAICCMLDKVMQTYVF